MAAKTIHRYFREVMVHLYATRCLEMNKVSIETTSETRMPVADTVSDHTQHVIRLKDRKPMENW